MVLYPIDRRFGILSSFHIPQLHFSRNVSVELSSMLIDFNEIGWSALELYYESMIMVLLLRQSPKVLMDIERISMNSGGIILSTSNHNRSKPPS